MSATIICKKKIAIKFDDGTYVSNLGVEGVVSRLIGFRDDIQLDIDTTKACGPMVESVNKISVALGRKLEKIGEDKKVHKFSLNVVKKTVVRAEKAEKVTAPVVPVGQLRPEIGEVLTSVEQANEVFRNYLGSVDKPRKEVRATASVQFGKGKLKGQINKMWGRLMRDGFPGLRRVEAEFKIIKESDEGGEIFKKASQDVDPFDVKGRKVNTPYLKFYLMFNIVK